MLSLAWLVGFAVVVELCVRERGRLLSFWLACAFSWHLDAFAAD